MRKFGKLCNLILSNAVLVGSKTQNFWVFQMKKNYINSNVLLKIFNHLKITLGGGGKGGIRSVSEENTFNI